MSQSPHRGNEKQVFDLVMRFGTSKSPKRTRSSTAFSAPAALGFGFLRRSTSCIPTVVRPCRFATPSFHSAQATQHSRKWLDAILGCLLCFPSGASHDGKTVRPNRFRGLTALASLSMAVSVGAYRVSRDSGSVAALVFDGTFCPDRFSEKSGVASRPTSLEPWLRLCLVGRSNELLSQISQKFRSPHAICRLVFFSLIFRIFSRCEPSPTAPQTMRDMA